MKIVINNFKVAPKDYNNIDNIIKDRYKDNLISYKILHRSIDARDKSNVFVVYKLMLDVKSTKSIKKYELYEEKNIDLSYPKWNDKSPIIVGFGPAGIFASLYLARCGANPIIIERGSKIEDRKKDVEEFFKTRVLNPNSNVQFGEGGAGAFSDGKLTTNVKSPYINFILNELYLHGAKEDILYDAKPHIGTDILSVVVKNIRLEIEKLGGKFYFNTQFLHAEEINDHLKVYASNDNIFETKHLILALGHSAKDTIRHLYNDMHLNMEQKSFSMGVRIEHKKCDIDYSQYGDFAKYLPAAYYKLACHNNDRGIYTFCMCPGGYVMASQSDENTIVVNGMSNSKRDNINSNSAILVDVKTSDYNSSDVLAGLSYQEKYERLAYELGSAYKAPANLVYEFLNGTVAKEERSIKTTYPHGLEFTDLSKCLPDYVIENLKFGIKQFDKKLKGFNNPDAILIGIESRSSSPVRILRDEYYMSSFNHIYPVGEGAGYAGGITSAALDGLKTALKITGQL